MNIVSDHKTQLKRKANMMENVTKRWLKTSHEELRNDISTYMIRLSQAHYTHIFRHNVKLFK